MVRTTGLGIWLNPLPLGQLVWNDNVKDHFHLPADAEVDIDLFFQRLHPEDRDRVSRGIEEAVETGEVFDATYRTVGPEGQVKWIRAVGRASYGADGAPTRFDGITLDMTQQVLAENRMREFADTAPTMLWVTEPDGRCSFLSRGWSDFTGQAQEQGLDFGWLEMVHPDDRGAAGDAFVQANARQAPFELEHRLRRADGSWAWVIDAGRPRFDAAHRFLGYVGAVTDIHARKLAEDALRRSEQRLRESDERYRAFVANSSEGIWRMEFDPPIDTRLSADEQVRQVLHSGRFAECNEAFARMYGLASIDAVVGRRLDLVMDEGAPQTQEYLRMLITSGYRASEVESEEHDAAGRPKWFANSISGVVEDGWLVRAWGTQRDVTDRKRAEMALLDADRRKDEFLATLAHELRNPLAPIRSAVQVMRLRGPDDPLLARHRDMIDRQVTHLAHLIDDLMDVSRITRNRLELRRAPVALQDVVRAALDNSRPDVESGQHPVQLEMPDEPLRLHGDEVRLVQVVMNLLTNAAKYSGRGTPIHVQVERLEYAARIRVRDQGQGIAAEELPRVFELFYQAETGTRRSQGGLGIGLSLVQRLTELHGGRVEARSEGPGRGSEFVVTLPLDLPAAAPAAARVSGPAGAARRILVVDDNRDGAETLAEVLRLLGHDVHTAYDGEQAVNLAERLRPEVVVMDLGMPRMDGFEACEAIRAQGWGRGVRMIAVSGWGQQADLARSRESGFDGHLVKPVAPDDVLAALARLQPPGAS